MLTFSPQKNTTSPVLTRLVAGQSQDSLFRCSAAATAWNLLVVWQQWPLGFSPLCLMARYKLWCQSPFGHVSSTSIVTWSWPSTPESRACTELWPWNCIAAYGQRKPNDTQRLWRLGQKPNLFLGPMQPQPTLPNRSLESITVDISASFQKPRPKIRLSLSSIIGIRNYLGISGHRKITA